MVRIFLGLMCSYMRVFTVLKAFLATFGGPFSYFQMVPHMHDPASI